ncbi:organic hydroperoxide resistance protein [Spirosoma oryzicola]|uniref:organic hydroperoxide resistance protein n=1 Tax=Spirosoma oryzicola TaxID=2898794 RepID=UPI001E48E8E1|nr:organic hydroperoxide resistance protein [Spirosoma oryzicola]UHG93083.1 organic hydroperoxide resistance protein [Spirosoma oryzicola]
MKTVYQTTVKAVGGRDGQVASEDGVLTLDVRVPQSMGGPAGSFTNPEQLFAAGYAACFDSALNLVARQQKLKINSTVSATVGLQMTDPTNFNLAVELAVQIEGPDKATAQALLEKAHATCPYSKAIHNNVQVNLQLID